MAFTSQIFAKPFYNLTAITGFLGYFACLAAVPIEAIFENKVIFDRIVVNYLAFIFVILIGNSVWYGIFCISYVRSKNLFKIFAALILIVKNIIDFSAMILFSIFILIDKIAIFLLVSTVLFYLVFVNAISLDALFFAPVKNQVQVFKTSVVFIGNCNFFAILIMFRPDRACLVLGQLVKK